MALAGPPPRFCPNCPHMPALVVSYRTADHALKDQVGSSYETMAEDAVVFSCPSCVYSESQRPDSL